MQWSQPFRHADHRRKVPDVRSGAFAHARLEEPPADRGGVHGHNGRAGMIVCCPTTTRIKGYPFEVAIAGKPPGVVLADQVKSQDWRARKATRKGRVTPAELAEVRAKLRALIG